MHPDADAFVVWHEETGDYASGSGEVDAISTCDVLIFSHV